MVPEEPGRREPDRERDKEKDGDVPAEEDEDPVATRRTHILEQVGPRGPCGGTLTPSASPGGPDGPDAPVSHVP